MIVPLFKDVLRLQLNLMNTLVLTIMKIFVTIDFTFIV